MDDRLRLCTDNNRQPQVPELLRPLTGDLELPLQEHLLFVPTYYLFFFNFHSGLPQRYLALEERCPIQ